MRRFVSALTIALATIALPLVSPGPVARASNGTRDLQTVALRRQDCAATSAGSIVGTARFSLDDQGGENVNPGGREIDVALTAGLPRSSYGVYVLGGSCQVLVHAGTLTTDDSGRGDLSVHVLGSVVPPDGILRVQVVAPADAVVPGTGPFTDVLTSDPTSAA